MLSRAQKIPLLQTADIQVAVQSVSSVISRRIVVLPDMANSVGHRKINSVWGNDNVTFSYLKRVYRHETDSDYDIYAYKSNFGQKISEDAVAGVTEMPGASQNASDDNNVHITICENMDKRHQVATIAHEGYGHAYVLYDQTRDYFTASHWNRYTTYTRTNYEGVKVFNDIILTPIDLNIALRRRIDIVTKQAQNNYDNRK